MLAAHINHHHFPSTSRIKNFLLFVFSQNYLEVSKIRFQKYSLMIIMQGTSYKSKIFMRQI